MPSLRRAVVSAAVALAVVLPSPALRAQAEPLAEPEPPAVEPPVDSAPPAAVSAPEPEQKQEKAKEQKKNKHGKSKVRVSGYLQTHFRVKVDSDNNGRRDSPNFRVQRARVQLSGKVSKRIGFVLEIDPRAPLVTGIMRDAYVSVKLPAHQRLRIGQQKTQFGYENRESSTRLFVVNRAEVSDALARGVTLRDIGVGLVGRVPLSGDLALEDAVNVVNGNGMNTQIDDTDMKNAWGRVGIRYRAGGLTGRFGVSGAVGNQFEIGDDEVDPADDSQFDFWRVGADLEIDHRWAFAVIEGAFGQDTITTAPMVGGVMAGEVSDSAGGYVLVAAKTPWRCGPLLRYDRVDDAFVRWTFGAWYGLPDDRVRLLLNAEIRSETDNAFYLWSQFRF